MSAQPRRARLRLPRALSIALTLVLVPTLLAVLALALTMLTRMVIERTNEPGLHWPTFWVWWALSMACLGIPVILGDIRGPGRQGPARQDLPEGVRVWLVFGAEAAGPVTEVALQRADEPAPRHTLVRAREMQPADVAFLERASTETALATPDGETLELTPLGLEVLDDDPGSLRGIIDELLSPSRRSIEELSADERDQLEEARSRERDLVDVTSDPTVVVPTGPVRRALGRVSVALWVLFVAGVIAVLVWRGLSDAGIGPDIDDYPWAINAGGAAILGLPFVLWGWHGLLTYVRAHEARRTPREVRAKARADFWFFGMVSALVMCFLGGITTLALWSMDLGLTAPLVGLTLTAGFVLLASWSGSRFTAARWVPRR